MLFYSRFDEQQSLAPPVVGRTERHYRELTSIAGGPARPFATIELTTERDGFITSASAALC